MLRVVFLALLFWAVVNGSEIRVGLEVLIDRQLDRDFQGKRVALLTHAAAVDRSLTPSYELLMSRAKKWQLVCLLAPEHGLDGATHAGESVKDGQRKEIPIYSLHGPRRRPTEAMLSGIDIILVDLQDIGLRYYTYISTLFYCMEEAAKKGIEVVVLDRPNPLGGMLVDGPMLEESVRSFVGYVNVPICHGMTIGEIARYFKGEYHIDCPLRVIAMEGWKRTDRYTQLGRAWIPPSPNIPEPDTPIFCAMTGPIGELGILNIGIGYTLPFKLIGAPWIDSASLAQALNQMRLPGVKFRPISYRPFYGKFKDELCHGVQLVITDWKQVRPTQVCFALLAALKERYPKQVAAAMTATTADRRAMFHKVLGTETIWQLLQQDRSPYSKMLALHKPQRQDFYQKRKKYLLTQYEP